jgi:hypothetical protein
MKVGKKVQEDGYEAYFAVSNAGEHATELQECGAKTDAGDKPVVCAYDKRMRKFNMQEDFS